MLSLFIKQGWSYTMRFKKMRKFTLKLVLCLATISISGLFVISIVVNTIVRNIIFTQVTSAVHSEMHSIATGIDTTLNIGNHIVFNLTNAFTELGREYIEPLSEIILDDYEFIAHIYVGFSDGSHYGVGNVDTYEDWDPRTRPWYEAAKAASGEIIITPPFISRVSNNNVICTIAKYTPDIGGQEAVVALSITDDYIFDIVNQYKLDFNGYLMLIGSNGELIAHPDYDNITNDGKNIFLHEISNGNILMDLLASENNVYIFEDENLSTSYLMPFNQESTGWTLIAVIPDVTISTLVSHYLAVILVAFVLVLSAIFAIIMIFMFIITKNMEESRIVKARLQAMLDSSPLLCTIFDENSNIIEANHEATNLFEIADKQQYIDDYFAFSPEFQPNGRSSREYALEMLRVAHKKGHSRFDWTYMTSRGEHIPCEEVVMSVKLENEHLLIAHTRDLRGFYKQKEAEHAAITDVLTGVYNRRYLMSTAAKKLKACVESNTDFSLLMIDADNFKKLNDTYGHLVGDEVLKILVSRTRSILRRDTFVARYGGEEFIVVLPKTDKAGAVNIAERIRRCIGSSSFNVKDVNVDVTVSIGVASRTDIPTTLEDLIEYADQALYHAKEAGRNCVMHYEDKKTDRES